MGIFESLSMNVHFSVYILTETRLREVAVLLEQAQQPLAALRAPVPAGSAPRSEPGRERGSAQTPSASLHSCREKISSYPYARSLSVISLCGKASSPSAEQVSNRASEEVLAFISCTCASSEKYFSNKRPTE